MFYLKEITSVFTSSKIALSSFSSSFGIAKVRYSRWQAYPDYAIFTDVASGLNYKRKGLKFRSTSRTAETIITTKLTGSPFYLVPSSFYLNGLS